MKAIDKAKSFLKKYRHAWVLSYFLIYMPWFVYLEKRTNVRHYMIHSPIDNHIPFIEYFIIHDGVMWRTILDPLFVVVHIHCCDCGLFPD